MAHSQTNPAAVRPGTFEIDPETGYQVRVSTHINRRPASNIHHAVRIADHLGLPLNYMVTLNFGLTSCRGASASRRFASLRTNYFGKWVTRPRRGEASVSTAPTFVWTLENAGNVLAVHWLVHIPAGRFADFKDRLPNWLGAVAGEILDEAAIHIRPAETPKAASKYILKGIDPAYASFYGVKHVPQGKVAGRRSGMSRNLGPTVKKRLRANGEYHVARWARPFPGSQPYAPTQMHP